MVLKKKFKIIITIAIIVIVLLTSWLFFTGPVNSKNTKGIEIKINRI